MRKLLTIVAAGLVALALVGLAAAGSDRNFVAHLTGAEEVPPRDTQAQGQAILHVSKDGTAITYKLIAVNIENVVAGHIHRGPVGVNGPVVANLISAAATTQMPNGIRAEGTITAADLVGPLAGHPLSDLLAEIEAGNAYVNVHTSQNPGGEIRGQLR
jgi:hypothetical protein